MEEKKHNFQITVPAVAAATGWYIGNLLCTTTASVTDAAGSGIVQGTANNQRIGDRIRVTKLEVIINIVPTIVAGETAGSTCRVMIVHDKEPHLGYPTSALIMDPDSDMGGMQNQVQKRRFTIMKDFVHEMVPLGTNAAAVIAKGPKFLSKFTFYPNQVIEYSGNGGVTANIVKHAYYVMYAADGGSCCTVRATALAHYVDA